jgi:proteasome lid subunit RPN8/RPN11
MFEAGVVVGQNETVLAWHVPSGRSSGFLPDSADLWTTLWNDREHLVGFAHTHPGSGVPAPSSIDLTTFAAIEKGLGRRLEWWIASSDRLISVTMTGMMGSSRAADGTYAFSVCEVLKEPSWLAELRQRSLIATNNVR